ncbi:MAG TPA: HAD family hydrolase, partial [Tepidisphaeraceae bacterium]
LFDMDGTLTLDAVDFADIRRQLGLTPTDSILDALTHMPPAERAEAEALVHAREAAAAAESALADGCADLLAWLDARGIGRALITRNRRSNVRTVFDRHGLHFDIAITREDGKFKPDPAPLLLACERLGVAPAQAWMVGDWKYDIEAGNAAGMPTVWLDLGRPTRAFDAVPTYTVPSLCELAAYLVRLIPV